MTYTQNLPSTLRKINKWKANGNELALADVRGADAPSYGCIKAQQLASGS